MPLKKCIVSFADGAGNYAKALMRLELSLKQVGFDGYFKGINDYAHIESPFHRGEGCVPYAFKAHSIKKAIEEGAELLLWCDSAVYATKPIDAVFDHIEREGYLLFENIGFSIGDYTSDACIKKHGMTREQAFYSPMLMGCCMGFDVKHNVAKKFLDQYIAAASDGVSYPGSWSNFNLEVSNDMRVKGHRHDQSTASILAQKLKMNLTNPQQTYFAYTEHKGKLPISKNVCLWSEGI